MFKEPELSILILDYAKPVESYICLQSVKQHIKFRHKVIFCDNGSGEDYSYFFMKQGLIDQLIVNKDSTGLGLGTRDLFALSQSYYSFYLQNDQYLIRDFHENEFHEITKCLQGQKDLGGNLISSVSLAGSPCGFGSYSERGHIIATERYKIWEAAGMLGAAGAGFAHADGPWREESIQKYYKENNLVHLEWPVPLVQDNGVFAVRDMKEGGLYCHRTDTKQLWVIIPPIMKNPAYPKFTDAEFEIAARGEWPDGKIPERELNDSFHCWDNTDLARMQDDYIKDLRNRIKEKNV